MKRFLILTVFTFFLSSFIYTQSVSVSPSRLYYNVPVGEYKSQSITVTNNSKTKQSFTVSFQDFEPSGNKGKVEHQKLGENIHSCAKWLSASPSFFELEPGTSKDVQILLQLPNLPEANSVKWAAISVKLAHERKKPDEKGDDVVGLGIIQTFQFAIFVFQTPPTVTKKSAEIISFKEVSASADSIRKLELKVNNTGDAIIDCASYIEIANVNTGEMYKLKAKKAFTILPGYSREILYELPADLKAGKYNILGVVDFGSEEEVAAAELEIIIQ